jgi:uncharacterized protein (DUF362 family)
MNDYLDNIKRVIINRRKFIVGASATVAAGMVAFLRQGGPILTPEVFPDKWWSLPNLRPPQSPVAILKAADYEKNLVELITHGIELCGLNVRGKVILLKPNLVEFAPGRPINTNPRVIGAAIEAFLRLEAKQVIVGEGAGHRRDTELLVEASGLGNILREFKTGFIDLNLDDLVAVKPKSQFMGAPELNFSKTLLGVDLLVSMPKLKTHHWVGATLGMKNLFGCVPGAVYGWPKNFLHWSGIPESIVDLAATLRPGFTIVDGIVGMEGNGPINGDARPFGAIICGTDVVAVDATCVRLMGMDPDKMGYIHAAGRFLGNVDPAHIQQRGESVASMTQPFKLIDRFQDLAIKTQAS